MSTLTLKDRSFSTGGSHDPLVHNPGIHFKNGLGGWNHAMSISDPVSRARFGAVMVERKADDRQGQV